MGPSSLLIPPEVLEERIRQAQLDYGILTDALRSKSQRQQNAARGIPEVLCGDWKHGRYNRGAGCRFIHGEWASTLTALMSMQGMGGVTGILPSPGDATQQMPRVQANEGRPTSICEIHAKVRSIDVLVIDGNGRRVCMKGSECKVAAAGDEASG